MKKVRPSQILLLALLPAMLWLFLNTTLNRHIHILADGYIIAHAHPFDRSQEGPFSRETHKHTKRELLLLGLYCEIVFSILTLLFLEPRLHERPLMRRVRIIHQITARKHYNVYLYHAPPASF